MCWCCWCVGLVCWNFVCSECTQFLLNFTTSPWMWIAQFLSERSERLFHEFHQWRTRLWLRVCAEWMWAKMATDSLPSSEVNCFGLVSDNGAEFYRMPLGIATILSIMEDHRKHKSICRNCVSCLYALCPHIRGELVQWFLFFLCLIINTTASPVDVRGGARFEEKCFPSLVRSQPNYKFAMQAALAPWNFSVLSTFSWD